MIMKTFGRNVTNTIGMLGDTLPSTFLPVQLDRRDDTTFDEWAYFGDKVEQDSASRHRN